MVKHEIVHSSRALSTLAEKYQIDEFVPNNPGNIRRYFKWSFRIVYEIFDDAVLILNVLHTSQEPTKDSAQ